MLKSIRTKIGVGAAVAFLGGYAAVGAFAAPDLTPWPDSRNSGTNNPTAAGETAEPTPTDGVPTATPDATPTATPDGVDGPSAEVEVCHSPPGNPDNAHTISVDEDALQEHLDHGDSAGPCPDGVPPGPPDGVGGPAAKVEVCHVPPGDPDNAHTISVSGNALEAHLEHGDSEGACPDGAPSAPPDGVDGPAAEVEVCHAPPGNPDSARTISVDEDELQEHLDHGDSEGACPEGVGPGSPSEE